MGCVGRPGGSMYVNQGMFDAVLRKYAALLAYEYESALRRSDVEAARRVRETLGHILVATVTGEGPDWCEPIGLLSESDRAALRHHLVRDLGVACETHGVYETPEVELIPHGPLYKLDVSRDGPDGLSRMFTLYDESERWDPADERLVSLVGDLGVEVSECRFVLLTPANGCPDMFEERALTIVMDDGYAVQEFPDVGRHLVWISMKIWGLLGEPIHSDAFSEGIKLWRELDEWADWPHKLSEVVGFHRFAVAADRGFVLTVEDDPDSGDPSVRVRSVLSGDCDWHFRLP